MRRQKEETGKAKVETEDKNIASGETEKEGTGKATEDKNIASEEVEEETARLTTV